MALILVTLHCAVVASAVEISNRFRSPRNPERRIRPTTNLIVLHTTEAPARSSLNKLSDRGEAHYCVTEEGRIFRIVDRDRMAFHAGRSMWNGKEDVDNFSIGIECVGYHNKPMPAPQVAAIRGLVKELKEMYRISDERVVCHSHVAYGTPNKWQKHRHRGRKRCGMLFAMPSMRKALGLKSRPAFDPDTRARRLAIGDDYLNKVLYGRIDTMRGAAGVAAKSSSDGWFSRMFGSSGGTKAKPASPPPRTPPRAKAKPKVGPKAGKPPASVADLKAQGYVKKGVISKDVTASKLAGAKWNSKDTYYVIRNKVISGNRIDEAHMEKGMSVWMKK